ncbi:MAG: hypothetical protein M4579_002859 [Chaenotheca gracillima]|nr:MAG: hypothetical protein M4579_002859 [Chaenotheca gracillima]
MARSALLSFSGENEGDDSSAGLTAGNDTHPVSEVTSSPSPSVSFSSDKENRSSVAASRNRAEKGKGRAVMSQTSTTPTLSSRRENGASGKRRRLADRDASPQTATADQDHHEGEAVDLTYYDPDQDMTERRAIRKGLRELNRDLNDSRSQYMDPHSTGLIDTVNKANEFFQGVKQTSDATIDSRLLVSTADLSYKKTTQLMLGNSAQGIDIDEFVSKCITFMRKGHAAPGHDATENPRRASQSQRVRRQRRNSDLSSDEGGDEGDALNWAHLGRKACFPHNSRPAVPSFLLGPLSLQKRVRAQNTTRRAHQRRINPAELVRPEELQAADIEKQENSNLTVLCTRIRKALVEAQEDGQKELAAEATTMEERLGRDLEDAELQGLFDKHGIYDDGGVGFFRFVTHPRSFGQTVENLFYVSFLIRDGSVGIAEDQHGLPTLHPSAPRTAAEIKEAGITKHQAVFSLDYKTWLDIIDAFGVKVPMIPDRSEADEASRADAVGARGWYG